MFVSYMMSSLYIPTYLVDNSSLYIGKSFLVTLISLKILKDFIIYITILVLCIYIQVLRYFFYKYHCFFLNTQMSSIFCSIQRMRNQLLVSKDAHYAIRIFFLLMRTQLHTSRDCRGLKMKTEYYLTTAVYGQHSAPFYSLLNPLCAILCHLFAALYLCVPPCTFGFMT